MKWFSAFCLSMLLLLSALPAAAAPPIVLFDEGHGQMFSRERAGELDLSELSALFEEAGARVHTSRTPLSDPLLRRTDVLIVSGPFAPYDAQEIRALHAFLERGGRLALMLHIGPPAARLLNSLGMAVSNGVVRERERILNENPLDFEVTELAPHPLTRGLQSFKIYGTWALHAENPQVRAVASTGSSAWVDLNRDKVYEPSEPTGRFDLILAAEPGKGRVVVFADDAIFQNRFLEGDNRQLAENLIQWLLPAPSESI